MQSQWERQMARERARNIVLGIAGAITWLLSVASLVKYLWGL
jgi:hypothetical protein